MTAPFEMGKFVGAPVRVQAFEGVSVAENTYAAGFCVAAHAHDAPLLSLVLQGTATEEIGSRTRELGAQSLLYTPAYERMGTAISRRAGGSTSSSLRGGSRASALARPRCRPRH